MQITQRTNNAMRLVMYCALIGDRVAPVSEIAHACNMSETHLSKIAHLLAGFGFITTVRGRAGGVKLARPPEELNVGQIARKTECGPPLVECMELTTNSCPLVEACRFRPVLARSLEAFFSVLDEYTVADLIAEPAELRRAMNI